MVLQQSPTITVPAGHHQLGLDPNQPARLHLHDGRWVASCPGCGFELAEGRDQARVERKAALQSCPVCVEAT